MNEGVLRQSTPEVDTTGLVALLEAGRFAELESQTHALLVKADDSGILWKILGVAQRLQGGDALAAFTRAAELLPGDAEAHANLGAALADLGRHREAIGSYQRALDLRPDDGSARYGLATAQRLLGDTDAALTSYRATLEREPSHAAALFNVGNLLLLGGQAVEAAASYRRVLGLSPELPEAHNNLGNALFQLGQFDAAATSYRRALALRPDYAAAHGNLAEALRELGRTNEAAASARRSLELRPGHAGTWNVLGNVLFDLGQADAALEAYGRALELEPRFAKAVINLAAVQRSLGLAADALASCERALGIEPRSAAAWVLRGELHADAGRFADATDSFRQAAAVDPDSPEACAGLANVRRMSAADADWLVQAERIAARPLPPRQELFLRYALGKYFDDLGEVDRAFPNYRRANELAARLGGPHDRQRVKRSIDRQLELFDGSSRDAPRSGAMDSVRPIFVVGMPRSGTTLVEQILASHPAVFGAGELPFWERAAAAPDGATSPAKLAEEYLRLLGRASSGARCVVDKMPANFMFLGLIHRALPDARIVHMQRHPLDTCLSIHFQQFRGGHSYAHDLDDLAHYYREYRRVMAEWRARLPAEVLLDLPYEGLVSDQEVWSRRLLEFVGLPWDPACLDFHLARRSVLTASKWQVRQKISKSSVGRWRRYARYLGPLIGGLGDVLAPEDRR
jgi:tetratricopeptide (TPR) repeat protein